MKVTEMTNKQKALEISRKHQIEYLVQIPKSNYLQKISSDSECFGSALEMAEWKDKQILDDVCEWIEQTPMYAKQPQQLIESLKEFLKAKNK